jgi:opacity protein-like surface antigen
MIEPVRVTGRVRRGAAVSLLAVATAAAASSCRKPPPEPIAFEGRAIVVENLTADEWQNVEVWLNDHYRVTKSRMPPGERFSIPLSAFVAGFGQRFDARRQPIRGVEVTATARDGRPVKLVWGTGRRR